MSQDKKIKVRYISIILMILCFALLFLGAYFIKSNFEALGYVSFVLAILVLIAYAVLESKYKKNMQILKLQEKKQDDSKLNKILEENQSLSSVVKIMYDLKCKNNYELLEVLRKTPCNIDYDYDEENDYYLTISHVESKKNTFVIVLGYEDKKEQLYINNDCIDVSEMSYDDIVSKIIESLSSSFNLEEPLEFEIKNRKAIFVVVSILIALSIGAIVTFIICLITKVMKEDMAPIILAPGIFLLLGIFLLYGTIREKLTFKDKELSYRGIFTYQSVNITRVKKVVIEFGSGTLPVIKYLDSNGNILMKYRDDGTSFKRGYLQRVINYYGIELEMM